MFPPLQCIDNVACVLQSQIIHLNASSSTHFTSPSDYFQSLVFRTFLICYIHYIFIYIHTYAHKYMHSYTDRTITNNVSQLFRHLPACLIYLILFNTLASSPLYECSMIYLTCLPTSVCKILLLWCHCKVYPQTHIFIYTNILKRA